MNKFKIILFALFFLNNCSFNENSSIWKDKENEFDNNENIKEVFAEKEQSISELNLGLKLNLTEIKINNKTESNLNNFGAQKYSGQLKKIGHYKFSKFEDINQFNFKPVFLKDGIIFFDKKGSIIRYNEKQKVLWKKNYYSKSEKKLQPKLNFIIDNQNLLVVDSIAKYYSINLNTGVLNWSKYNIYPFNSEIKKNKGKIFVIDYKNTLRCYNIENGSECWNLQTENSFTISDSKYSLIILNDNIVFSNSIGDITSVNVESGLITWQLPTQSNKIINETYNFKISKLVSDGISIFFSNNKNEFYSIDAKTGTINWINKINSKIKPIIIENLIFTISEEGYLFVIEKNDGKILRATNLYKNYKNKKIKKNPVGFVVGDKKLYLTNSEGKLIIVDIDLGDAIKEEKISGKFVSEPFIFNNNLFVLRNGSILQYN